MYIRFIQSIYKLNASMGKFFTPNKPKNLNPLFKPEIAHAFFAQFAAFLIRERNLPTFQQMNLF